ncbi:hypothetical protein RHSIM_RhsimUnG0099600 [Rhododendron simsii]|uniref:Uncharacterized protein n=1 Tax=Rhododendron simsii TaxID=118357 RepID=A0A834FVV1_RHOSS|nr:hypothetical protein RHSIM_RhsimUnG0099600 [Rhododendron simsii]
MEIAGSHGHHSKVAGMLERNGSLRDNAYRAELRGCCTGMVDCERIDWILMCITSRTNEIRTSR